MMGPSMVQDSAKNDAAGAWDALAPSQDARDLATTVRRYFAEEFGTGRMRQELTDGVSMAPAWRSLLELGLPSIGLSEASGGDGTLLDCAIMLEEAGRALVTAPLLSSAMAALTQDSVGLHRAAWQLEPGSFGLAVGDSRSMTVDLLDARDESRLTLVIPIGDEVRVLVVDPADRGAFELETITHIDPTRPLSRARLHPDALRGLGTAVAVPLDDLLAPARVAVASDLVGLAAAALESVTAHVVTRHQFGQPIGGFQAVKHALADGYVLVERARSLTWGAAIVTADGPAPSHEAADLSRLAKAAAADAACHLSRLHTQLLGALGMTFEADSHLFVRRATQTIPTLGSATDLYAAVATDRHERSRRA